MNPKQMTALLSAAALVLSEHLAELQRRLEPHLDTDVASEVTETVVAVVSAPSSGPIVVEPGAGMLTLTGFGPTIEIDG